MPKHRPDPFKELLKARRREKEQALKELERLTGLKAKLQRPVFFVPGWTDETCVCWKTPYLAGYIPAQSWITRIFTNHRLAAFITFSKRESENCHSFFDFSEFLKIKIRKRMRRRRSLDVIGHSMGGLDTVTAVIDSHDPLKGINNLITVATPHQGSQLGEIGPIFRKYQQHHAIQCVNLDPDQTPIKLINRPEARQTLLSRIVKLYCLMGTRDQTVMRSARFSSDGLEPELCREKIEVIEFGGATHSQKYGIPQDPRVVLAIIRILMGQAPGEMVG